MSKKMDQTLAKLALDEHKRKYGIDTGAVGFLEESWKTDFSLAMDAQPTLITEQCDSSIPDHVHRSGRIARLDRQERCRPHLR